MTDYQLTSVLTRGGTDVLVIHCGDYRFQSAFREFLAQTLALEGKCDLMVIPGGPLSLTLAEYLPKFSWSSWKWLRFFVEHHEIRRLILIQHQDCGFYKTMPHHLHSSTDPRKRQEQDLRRAAVALKKDLPNLAVELFYAGLDAADRIHIEQVST
jgi:hypothetical protein